MGKVKVHFGRCRVATFNSKNAESNNNFEFQINDNYCFKELVCLIQYLGHPYAKTLFVFQLKFNFNWTSPILSGTHSQMSTLQLHVSYE